MNTFLDISDDFILNAQPTVGDKFTVNDCLGALDNHIDDSNPYLIYPLELNSLKLL